MIKLSNIFKHTIKIFVHKFYVCKYCFACGLYWRGITHDMSKFSPVEFFESAKYYKGDESPIVVCKRDKGYSLAWMHHKGHNSHHYEYWVDKLDDGGEPLKMPINDLKELICDYVGAGHAYLGNKFTYEKEFNWWLNKINNDHPKIHPDTRNFITLCLSKFKERNNFYDVFDYARYIFHY